MTCPDCNGTGLVQLFTSLDRCQRCGGSGTGEETWQAEALAEAGADAWRKSLLELQQRLGPEEFRKMITGALVRWRTKNPG
jgi:DnaJ-class molecular chaperone